MTDHGYPNATHQGPMSMTTASALHSAMLPPHMQAQPHPLGCCDPNSAVMVSLGGDPRGALSAACTCGLPNCPRLMPPGSAGAAAAGEGPPAIFAACNPAALDPGALYSSLGAAYGMKDAPDILRGALPHLNGFYPYDPATMMYPYMNGYGGIDARRKNATKESTNTLKAWLYEHRKNPYPTKGEKIMLAILTKMTLTQVSTWFANARRRLKKESHKPWDAKGDDDDDADDDEDEDEDGDVSAQRRRRRRSGDNSGDCDVSACAESPRGSELDSELDNIDCDSRSNAENGDIDIENDDENEEDNKLVENLRNFHNHHQHYHHQSHVIHHVAPRDCPGIVESKKAEHRHEPKIDPITPPPSPKDDRNRTMPSFNPSSQSQPSLHRPMSTPERSASLSPSVSKSPDNSSPLRTSVSGRVHSNNSQSEKPKIWSIADVMNSKDSSSSTSLRSVSDASVTNTPMYARPPPVTSGHVILQGHMYGLAQPAGALNGMVLSNPPSAATYGLPYYPFGLPNHPGVIAGAPASPHTPSPSTTLTTSTRTTFSGGVQMPSLNGLPYGVTVSRPSPDLRGVVKPRPGQVAAQIYASVTSNSRKAETEAKLRDLHRPHHSSPTAFRPVVQKHL